VLKIDRSFIPGLGTTPSASQIVAATIDMARAFGMSVVAEGVETEGQLRQLQDLGCHFAQGYYFARPQPPEAIAALLKSSRRPETVSRSKRLPSRTGLS